MSRSRPSQTGRSTPGREVANEQHRLQAHAADERERLAVGRYARRDRAAGPRGDGALLAGREVAPDDGVDRPVWILVVLERRTGRDVLAVIQVPAIRRDGRLARVLLPAVLLGDLQAFAPAGVVHPDLTGAERAFLHEVAPDEDVLAVVRPRRAVDEPALLLAHLPRPAAVPRHHPDVPETVAIARERDRFAVGAEARLHVERRAAGEALGDAPATPRDRHDVEITEQVEDDLPAVRTDVDVHPRALVGLERERPGGPERLRDVPLRLVAGAGVLVGRRRRGRLVGDERDTSRREQRGDGQQESVSHGCRRPSHGLAGRCRNASVPCG